MAAISATVIALVLPLVGITRSGRAATPQRASQRTACSQWGCSVAVGRNEKSVASGMSPARRVSVVAKRRAWMVPSTGVSIDSDDTATLFGEDQGRYLIACNFDAAEALMIAAGRAGVTLTTVGRFTGDEVKFGSSSAPLDELSRAWKGAFAEHFA